jgi:hypothetical protein
MTPRARTSASCLGVILGSVAWVAPALAAPPTIQGCLDASEASVELESKDRLLATREALRTCASLGCPQEIRDECARRLDLVQQSIPSVTCEVRDQLGQPRHDVTVAVDGGAALATPGEELELDPGPHSFEARGGDTTNARTLSLGVREKKRNLVFVLPRSSTPPLAPRRVAALVTGGVGAASLLTATVFTFVALDRKREAREVCPEATCPSPLGAEGWRDAWQAGNIATGFAIGGVVALAAATGLWFSVGTPSTTVAVGPGQLQWKTRF